MAFSQFIQLLVVCCCIIQFSSSVNLSNNSNSTNITTLTGTREYSVRFKVSNFFLSGTSDNLYFQLCATNYFPCTPFYLVDKGMPNTGESYTFVFNTTNIGDIDHVIIASNGTDAFCLSRIQVDSYPEINNIITDCLDTSGNGECDILNITISTGKFVPSTQTPCALNLSNVYKEEIVVPEGYRLYSMVFTVSSIPFSGSSSVFWFRLCNTTNYATLKPVEDKCTAWDNLGLLLENEGSQYRMNYIPLDIGSVDVLQIATFDDDRLCLSEVTVDGNTEKFSPLGCIDNTGESNSCDTLSIVFDSTTVAFFDTTQSAVCPYNIISNASIVKVDQYVFTFEVSGIPSFGTDDNIYFFVQSRDGGKTTIYKIVHPLERSKSYTFAIDITNENSFDSLSDIFLLYLFTIGTDKFCLSKYDINGLWINDYPALIPKCLQYSGLKGDGGCDVLQINVVTKNVVEYQNSSCGFDYSKSVDIGTIVELTWYQWVEIYWYVVASSILGFIILVIGCCWFVFYCAKKKKSEDGQVKSTLSYGGNAAFT